MTSYGKIRSDYETKVDDIIGRIKQQYFFVEVREIASGHPILGSRYSHEIEPEIKFPTIDDTYNWCERNNVIVVKSWLDAERAADVYRDGANNVYRSRGSRITRQYELALRQQKETLRDIAETSPITDEEWDSIIKPWATRIKQNGWEQQAAANPLVRPD